MDLSFWFSSGNSLSFRAACSVDNNLNCLVSYSGISLHFIRLIYVYPLRKVVLLRSGYDLYVWVNEQRQLER